MNMNLSNSTSDQNFNQKLLKTDKFCQSCSTKFNVFKRKKKCTYCELNFCGKCVKPCKPRSIGAFSNQSRRHKNDTMACDKCMLISSPIVSIEQLMKIETKYLLLYLMNSKVSIAGYPEKIDLARLILNHNNNANNSTNTSSNENEHDSLSTNENANEIPEVPISLTSSMNSLLNHNSLTNPTHFDEASNVMSTSQEHTLQKHASLSDLKSAQDIEDLNIRQIKEILTYNFVDYRDCFEKKELVERLKRLYNDSIETKNIENVTSNESKENLQSTSNETNMCKICMDQAIDCVLLNCGHMCSCVKCGKLLSECPICRQYVVKVMRVFKC